MARAMFVALADHAERFVATGAGTFVIEGQPMSVRTRTALARYDIVDRTHRSLQLWAIDARRADLLVAMAPEHVEWVRREMPEAAPRTVTLKRLVAALPDLAPQLSLGGQSFEHPSFHRWVAALGAGEVTLEPWEEIVDPAGGEQPDVDQCAAEIHGLIAALAAGLASPGPAPPAGQWR
jgi:protein-tyrosine-phosphatase